MQLKIVFIFVVVCLGVLVLGEEEKGGEVIEMESNGGRFKRDCLPPSCYGNCFSGHCSYWCSMCREGDEASLVHQESNGVAMKQESHGGRNKREEGKEIVRSHPRFKRGCLPPSCYGNCMSGNCPWWCDQCPGAWGK